MTEDREWLKGIRTNGGLGDFIDLLAAKAVRNAFDGLPRESALFTELKQAVITTVRNANGSGSCTLLPSDALHGIVADLDRELGADNTAPLTPLAVLYKAYTAERAANPPAPAGRQIP